MILLILTSHWLEDYDEASDDLLRQKYPALFYFAFFWSVPGSCCSDLIHLNLIIIIIIIIIAFILITVAVILTATATVIICT